MDSRFVARKCACGGKLEFNTEKKIWICKYCGTVIEREATFDKIHVDGIEGINDVVRQTLMDIANRNMAGAYKNLDDCERKGHQHIGTLIANISYYLANISEAKSRDEAMASLDKVKIYAGRLKTEFPVIGIDEINLYESFGENSSDIYANLMIVFDTLGDMGRVEYVSGKIRPQEVFSPHVNKSLLKISIKHQKYDVVDMIIANSNHIDKSNALQEILDNYPDNDRKIGLLNQLLDEKVAEKLSKKYFEEYFKNSTDSAKMKVSVIKRLENTRIRCDAEAVVRAVYPQINSYDSAREVFDAIYSVKITDQENGAIINYCLIVNQSYEIVQALFDTMIEKNVFLMLNANSVISFLDTSEFSGNEKLEILKRMLTFEFDGKALDAIYNYYLNNNNDSEEIRIKIIDELLKNDAPISAGTIKRYVVRTQTDGENKLYVLEKILQTGINKTYIGNLLSDYLLETSDDDKLKEKISEYLINQGFKTDANTLSQYIISSSDDSQMKINKVKKIVSNGTQIKPDCIDAYIMSLKEPQDFSEDMFNLLTNINFNIGFNAYIKFLLWCRDIDKIRHNQILLGVVGNELGMKTVNIRHAGNNISCNIFQAYVLCTIDHYEVSKAICETFSALRIKLNTDISVNNSYIKFKKYAGERKNSLSPLTLQLCEEYKIFSLF